MVTYESKYGKDVAEFDPLEWMAALVSHIPDRGAQTVHYYGRYSNATRGKLKKEDTEPQYHIIEDETPGGLKQVLGSAYTEDRSAGARNFISRE